MIYTHQKTNFFLSQGVMTRELHFCTSCVLIYSFSNIVSDSYSYPDRKEHGEWPSVDLLTQGFSFPFNS